ncbi:MAG: hypothetical protein FD180_1495 [Planctomycetota bacterium]|nr:MAG: hypothetical protein FD180_1495 [Planctomycetota bacterium]
MRHIAAGFVLALLCSLCGLSEEPKEEGIGWEVQLKNGSLIKGSIENLASIELKTRHGLLKFALKDVRGLAWGNASEGEFDTVTTSEEVFKGRIENFATLDFNTGFGLLKIPASALRTLFISKPGNDSLPKDKPRDPVIVSPEHC